MMAVSMEALKAANSCMKSLGMKRKSNVPSRRAMYPSMLIPRPRMILRMAEKIVNRWQERIQQLWPQLCIPHRRSSSAEQLCYSSSAQALRRNSQLCGSISFGEGYQEGYHYETHPIICQLAFGTDRGQRQCTTDSALGHRDQSKNRHGHSGQTSG